MFHCNSSPRILDLEGRWNMMKWKWRCNKLFWTLRSYFVNLYRSVGIALRSTPYAFIKKKKFFFGTLLYETKKAFYLKTWMMFSFDDIICWKSHISCSRQTFVLSSVDMANSKQLCFLWMRQTKNLSYILYTTSRRTLSKCSRSIRSFHQVAQWRLPFKM